MAPRSFFHTVLHPPRSYSMLVVISTRDPFAKVLELSTELAHPTLRIWEQADLSSGRLRRSRRDQQLSGVIVVRACGLTCVLRSAHRRSPTSRLRLRRSGDHPSDRR